MSGSRQIRKRVEDVVGADTRFLRVLKSLNRHGFSHHYEPGKNMSDIF